MKSCRREASLLPARWAPGCEMFSRGAIAALALSLCACQSNGPADAGLAPGARVVLHRSLTIPAEETGVWLQDGRVLTAGEVQRYYPHCRLEVRRRLAQTQTVEPDEFIVTRVSQTLLHTVRATPPGVDPMAVKVGFRFASDGGPSIQTLATLVDLGSNRQPDVMRLSCGQLEVPPQYIRHVTLGDIRGALGDVITLRLGDQDR